MGECACCAFKWSINEMKSCGRFSLRIIFKSINLRAQKRTISLLNNNFSRWMTWTEWAKWPELLDSCTWFDISNECMCLCKAIWHMVNFLIQKMIKCRHRKSRLSRCKSSEKEWKWNRRRLANVNGKRAINHISRVHKSMWTEQLPQSPQIWWNQQQCELRTIAFGKEKSVEIMTRSAGEHNLSTFLIQIS